MRQRDIMAMILLSIVTFGIYSIYWFVSTTREMRNLGASIPNCIWIIIPLANIWWLYKYSEGVDHVTNEKLSTILTFLLLWIVSIIGIFIVQDSFNHVGGAETVPATATPPVDPSPETDLITEAPSVSEPNAPVDPSPETGITPETEDTPTNTPIATPPTNLVQ